MRVDGVEEEVAGEEVRGARRVSTGKEQVVRQDVVKGESGGGERWSRK